MQLLHHFEKLILVECSMITLAVWSLVYSCDNQVNITCFNGKLSCHRPKYLYSYEPISISVLESVFNKVFNNLNKALSFFSHRVFQLIDFLDSVFHLIFELFEKDFVSVGVNFRTRLTVFNELVLSVLLFFLFDLFYLILLLGNYLLVECL